MVLRSNYREASEPKHRVPCFAQLRLPGGVRTNIEYGTPYIYVNEWLTEKVRDRFASGVVTYSCWQLGRANAKFKCEVLGGVRA